MSRLFEQCDFHIHTCLSGCARGEMRIPDIVRVCGEQGLRLVGLTDHIFPSTDPVILRRTRDELTRLDTGDLKVYLGCEADVTAEGSHVVGPQVLEAVDYVMVASNHYQLPWVSRPQHGSAEQIAAHFLKMFRYACTLEFADIIAHPLCEVSGEYGHDFTSAISDAQIVEALELAAQNGIAMEISPRSLTRMSSSFRRRFYGLCRDVGLRFAIGSDSHSLESIGRTRELARIIHELGITDEEIWLPDRRAVQGAVSYRSAPAD